MIRLCQQCTASFRTYENWVRRGGGKFCSFACSSKAKAGKASYVRSEEHRAAMSKLKKEEDNTAKRERFLLINEAKRGKTIEELYPAKAAELRALRKAQVGDKNPNWRGGKHRNKYPYEFYKLRVAVLDRDGWICLNCNMTQEEAKSRDSLGRGLTVHHVDYDKSNNDLSNLVTTCKWCNSKANGRREQWQTHYAQLLG